MRYAIIGDVGGHYAQFAATLDALNIHNGVIPDGLHVVQVGDLIHKGPDSDVIVKEVDRLLDSPTGQWTQLAGNHEAQHLGGIPFWRCDCSLSTINTLNEWKRRHKIRVAATFYANGRDWLITHAGLTAEYCDMLLDNEKLPALPHVYRQLADILNDLWQEPTHPLIHSPGAIINVPSPAPPGPLWAICDSEVWESWLNHPYPLNQIHGHTTLRMWEHDQWLKTPERTWQHHAHLDFHNRTTTQGFPHSQSLIVSVDPGFDTPTPKIRHIPWWEGTS